jgi:hypothetical protein
LVKLLTVCVVNVLGVNTIFLVGLVCSGSNTSLGNLTLEMDCLSEMEGEPWLGVEG